MPLPRRLFSEADDQLVRDARAGKLPMREAARQLRTSLERIYLRMAEIGLQPYRRPHRRTRPGPPQRDAMTRRKDFEERRP